MRALVSLLLVGWVVVFVPAAAAAPGVVVAVDAVQPQVAVDADGGIHVAFLHQGNIAVSASTDRGKTFREPVVAIDVKGRARGGKQRGPRIGVDAKKNLYVTAPVTFDDAEYHKPYPVAELYLATSADGGKTWSKPVQVNEVDKQAPEALHWMAVAPDGIVHIAWLDHRGRLERGQDLYYARVVNGVVGKNVKVASTVCECCAPGLAVDHAGHPFLAYREGGAKESREIFALRSTDQGRTFTPAVQVNQQPTRESGCPMSAPVVAVSADGKRFAVVWKDRRSGEANVYWSLAAEPVFRQDALVHQDTAGEQNHPSVAIAAGGVVWTVWGDHRQGRRQVRVRCSTPGDADRLVSDPSDSRAGYPVVACNAGLVVVVYEVERQGRNLVECRPLQAAPE
jgi:hypothetical protein